ncbi:MAG TPA: MBL fold metallo-hydrolase [Planctomycetaceae bacterium]|nr:MBL fold metallo-hydrolase [Planctomycetaceae bacterium]
MRVVFLGTGGYHPNKRRHTACILLPDIGVALDAGTGFFRVQETIKSANLDIFLTHAHLDHICGLTFLLVPMLRGDMERVRVFGTANTLQAVRTHLLANELFPVMPDFEWHVLGDGVPLPDNGKLTWTALDHPGGSVGFRLDWEGKSLAYITDTTAPGSYADFVRGVDMLIHECYFPDDMADWAEKTGHSSSTNVAELARAAQIKRLYIVHVDPQRPDDDPLGMKGIRAIFANTELAEDLMEIEF